MAWVCAVMVLAITSPSAPFASEQVRSGLRSLAAVLCPGTAGLRSGPCGQSAIGAEAAARLAHRVTIGRPAAGSGDADDGTGLTAGPGLKGVLPSGCWRWRCFGRAGALDRSIPAACRNAGQPAGRLCHVCPERAPRGRRGSTDGHGVGDAPLARWAWAAGLLLLVQVALGGQVSAAHAGRLPCVGQLRSERCLLGDPEPLGATAGRGAAHRPEGAWVHLLRSAGAVLLTVVLWLMAWRAWRLGQRGTARG